MKISFVVLIISTFLISFIHEVHASSKAELNAKLSGYNCSYTDDATKPNCKIDDIVKVLKAAKKSGELAKEKQTKLISNIYGNSDVVNSERWEEIRYDLEGLGYNIDDYTLHTITKGFKPKTMNKITFEVK